MYKFVTLSVGIPLFSDKVIILLMEITGALFDFVNAMVNILIECVLLAYRIVGVEITSLITLLIIICAVIENMHRSETLDTSPPPPPQQRRKKDKPIVGEWHIKLCINGVNRRFCIRHETVLEHILAQEEIYFGPNKKHPGYCYIDSDRDEVLILNNEDLREAFHDLPVNRTCLKLTLNRKTPQPIVPNVPFRQPTQRGRPSGTNSWGHPPAKTHGPIPAPNVSDSDDEEYDNANDGSSSSEEGEEEENMTTSLVSRFTNVFSSGQETDKKHK